MVEAAFPSDVVSQGDNDLLGSLQDAARQAEQGLCCLAASVRAELQQPDGLGGVWEEGVGAKSWGHPKPKRCIEIRLVAIQARNASVCVRVFSWEFAVCNLKAMKLILSRAVSQCMKGAVFLDLDPCCENALGAGMWWSLLSSSHWCLSLPFVGSGNATRGPTGTSAAFLHHSLNLRQLPHLEASMVPLNTPWVKLRWVFASVLSLKPHLSNWAEAFLKSSVQPQLK